MKYLKYLLGIVAVLGILFIGKGFLTPTISYTNEITVDKSIEEAWAVMNDESKLKQWIENIKSAELVSGTKGTVGAVTKYISEQDGQKSEITETIRSITPNKHIAMDFDIDFMTMDYQTFFSEKDGKTNIRTETIVEGNGMIAKSMISFMKNAMKTQSDEDMGRLKKLIDENTTNYFPEPVVEAVEEVQE